MRSFSAFLQSLKSGVSTAVQSMLAVLGAVGLQSGASQEAEEVEQRMKQHIESIMGDKLSRAKEQVEELQEAYKPEPSTKEGKPLKVSRNGSVYCNWCWPTASQAIYGRSVPSGCLLLPYWAKACRLYGNNCIPV